MTIRIPRWLMSCAAILTVSVIAASCTHATPHAGQVQKQAVAQQQLGLQPLIDKQPPYFPPFSDERSNINERTARFSDPNRVSYITVLTVQGGILFHGTVKGKVSSVDSQVTPADGMDCEHFGGTDPRPDGCGVVQIAEPDGSWGTNNPSAIFWFDTSNVYHETTLPCFVTDQEQTLATPPVLNITAPAAPLKNALDSTGKTG